MAFGMKSDKQDDEPEAAAEATEASEDTTETTEPTATERPSFRPDFLDKDTPQPAARGAATGAVFFVSVAKGGGDEIYRFDDAATTQAFVEQLLEQGVAAEDVAAYAGRRLDFKVSHRPVVSLSRD
jgi:hypothetical protein